MKMAGAEHTLAKKAGGREGGKGGVSTLTDTMLVQSLAQLQGLYVICFPDYIVTSEPRYRDVVKLNSKYQESDNARIRSRPTGQFLIQSLITSTPASALEM